MLRGDQSEQGRFGSSLAVLPDVNGDGFNDLAVGAPLENNGHGSIYLFHGEGVGSSGLTFSQVTEQKKKKHSYFADLLLCNQTLKGLWVSYRELLALEV